MNAINYDAPGVAEKFVLVKLEAAFPPATRKSSRAHADIVAQMVANGADKATAEKMAKASMDLYPDGELKAIKTPFYSFTTWLDRVTIRWLGGKGSPKLISVHMLDKAEQKFAESQLVKLPLESDFVAKHDRIVESLCNRAGHYLDPSDYPASDQLQHMFKYELTFTPIGDPSQFDMGVIPENQRQRMVDALNETAEAVTKEYADSLRVALQSLSQQLIGGKVDGKFTRFSENNVTNLLDMVAANLNASGNAELAEALDDVKHAAEMAATAAVHKDNKATRTSAANAASRAANKLAGLF